MINRVEGERNKRKEENVRVFISSVSSAPMRSSFFSSHSSRQAGPVLVSDYGDNVLSTDPLGLGMGFPLWLVLAVLSYLFFFFFPF